MYSSDGGLPEREFARWKRMFEMTFSFSPFLTHYSLSHSGGGLDCGKNAGTKSARAVRCGEQGTGNCASDDMHFAHAAGQSALRGFKLQDHSARHFIPAYEIFDFTTANGAQNFFSVENAGDIGEKNQTVGLDEFRGGCSHMIGVNVVEFAVGAKSQTRGDRNDLGAPKRAKKINIYFGKIADESKAAFAFTDLHGLGQKACSVGSADAHCRLPRKRDGSGKTLIQQAGKNHYGGIASFAIGDAQPVDEMAGNSHALQRAGEDFSAAVNYEHFISGAREFADLPRDLLYCLRTFKKSARNFYYKSHSNPAVSV